jgi:hypothetical protein
MPPSLTVCLGLAAYLPLWEFWLLLLSAWISMAAYKPFCLHVFLDLWLLACLPDSLLTCLFHCLFLVICLPILVCLPSRAGHKVR